MRNIDILASTFGMDTVDMKDYKYQPGKTKVTIYAIGDFYYCCTSKKTSPPTGWNWKLYSDQFWAIKHNRVIWIASSEVH